MKYTNKTTSRPLQVTLVEGHGLVNLSNSIKQISLIVITITITRTIAITIPLLLLLIIIMIMIMKHQ